LIAVMGVLLLSGLALGYQRSITLTASNAGGGGTLYGYHNYYSYSTTQWRKTNMQYRVTGNTRTENDVYIKLYSQGALVWSHSRGDVVGGHALETFDVSRTTYKNATKSWWKIIADVNNWFDPAAEGWIATF
jgi:hypothetical protein